MSGSGPWHDTLSMILHAFWDSQDRQGNFKMQIMVTLRTTILLLLLIASAPQFAQTIISGGSVSGVWESEGNPYLVEGNITIEPDDRLTVKPGVEVLFTGNYSLEVYGRIEAVGTAQEKVLFSLQDTTGFAVGSAGWGGIAFLGFYAQQTEDSGLDHCIVEYSAGNGITCLEYPNLTIANTTARYNRYQGIVLYEFSDITMHGLHLHHNGTGGLEAQFSAIQVSDFLIEHNNGTGVSLSGSSYGPEGALLEQGTVAYNHSPVPGGGMQVLMDASATIVDVTIRNNSASLGGGIFCSWADVTLDGAEITGNQAMQGGGIYGDAESHLALDRCLLAANTALQEGGALFLEDAAMDMVRSTVTANTAGAGGAVWHQAWFGEPAAISSSILWGNSPDEIVADGNGPEVTWSDVAGGHAGDGNIDADPLFENAENGDYHLSWADYPSLNGSRSPCIDAGNPDLPSDPDGTVADMGAYSFDQEAITGMEEDKAVAFSCYPNPSSGILHLRSDDPMQRVGIYSLTGQKVMEQELGSNAATLDIGSVGSGVYIVILEGTGGATTTVKLVKE